MCGKHSRYSLMQWPRPTQSINHHQSLTERSPQSPKAQPMSTHPPNNPRQIAVKAKCVQKAKRESFSASHAAARQGNFPAACVAMPRAVKVLRLNASPPSSLLQQMPCSMRVRNAAGACQNVRQCNVLPSPERERGRVVGRNACCRCLLHPS